MEIRHGSNWSTTLVQRWFQFTSKSVGILLANGIEHVPSLYLLQSSTVSEYFIGMFRRRQIFTPDE